MERPAQPSDDSKTRKLPGHWLLARLGKRVLRPGGIELTRKLLEAIQICAEDDVIEFAPGLGLTGAMSLGCRPRSYLAIERDEAAAALLERRFAGTGAKCVLADADATGQPDGIASVVYGEAMLTMQSTEKRRRIVAEAARLLRPGGRYGIHEIALTPDDIDRSVRNRLVRDLSAAVHHTVAPLTRAGWRELLESKGLRVCAEAEAPMHLLEPRRLIQDEGITRALRFVWNIVRCREARRRVAAMRGAFQRHRDHTMAIMLVAKKV